jgi:hypothetical protein
MKSHPLIVVDHYLKKTFRIKQESIYSAVFAIFILFRLEPILIGEVGDNIAVVDTDDVDDEGSI